MRKKTAIRFNPIEQGGQRLPMPGAEIKVAWVWSHSKRLLTQLIEIEEHWFYLSFFGNDATTGLHRNDSTSSRASASVLTDRLFWESSISGLGLFVPAPWHPMPVRTTNRPKREAWLRSTCTILLATSCSFASINPPIWLAQITLSDMQMDRINSDWLGLP